MIDLTNKQRNGFFQTGFFILPNVFSPDEIDEMKGSFQSLQETAFSLANLHLEELKPEKETYVMHQGSQFVLGRIQRGINCGQPSIRRVMVWGSRAVIVQIWERPQVIVCCKSVAGIKRDEPTDQSSPFQVTRG